MICPSLSIADMIPSFSYPQIHRKQIIGASPSKKCQSLVTKTTRKLHSVVTGKSLPCRKIRTKFFPCVPHPKVVNPLPFLKWCIALTNFCTKNHIMYFDHLIKDYSSMKKKIISPGSKVDYHAKSHFFILLVWITCCFK